MVDLFDFNLFESCHQSGWMAKAGLLPKVHPIAAFFLQQEYTPC
jgi:hypothetical protein